MKTIIHLDLNDDQLVALASLFAGKQVTRPATRNEIPAFVVGMIDNASAEAHRASVQSFHVERQPTEKMLANAREKVGKGFNFKTYIQGLNKQPIIMEEAR